MDILPWIESNFFGSWRNYYSTDDKIYKGCLYLKILKTQNSLSAWWWLIEPNSKDELGQSNFLIKLKHWFVFPICHWQPFNTKIFGQIFCILQNVLVFTIVIFAAKSSTNIKILTRITIWSAALIFLLSHQNPGWDKDFKMDKKIFDNNENIWLESELYIIDPRIER